MTKFICREKTLFASCHSCIKEFEEVFVFDENLETARRCFLRYFVEKKNLQI